MNNFIPQAATVFPSNDGTTYDRYEDAIAGNISILLGGEKRDASVTPAIAKNIVENRDAIIAMLSSIENREAADAS